jgi:hypothetical protein
MIRLLAGSCLAGLAGLFGLAFYERYWRWRDCFNELGRCYDPQSQEVFLEQSGIAWASLALAGFAGALVLFIRIRRS